MNTFFTTLAHGGITLQEASPVHTRKNYSELVSVYQAIHPIDTGYLYHTLARYTAGLLYSLLVLPLARYTVDNNMLYC